MRTSNTTGSHTLDPHRTSGGLEPEVLPFNQAKKQPQLATLKNSKVATSGAFS